MGRERPISRGEIGMKGDASADKRDCDLDTRAMVKFAKKLFDRSWMKRIFGDLEVGYNMRWKVECTFSDLKRCSGMSCGPGRA